MEIACISSLLSVIICYSYSHHNTYISLQDLALKKKGIFFIMFKCQPGYTLRKIKGINYLLPYGQQIADLKKGFVLNETSTFLWNVLQHHEGAEPQSSGWDRTKYIFKIIHIDISFSYYFCIILIIRHVYKICLYELFFENS